MATPSQIVVSPASRGGFRQQKKQASGFHGSRESSGCRGKGSAPPLTDWMLFSSSSSWRSGLSLNTELAQKSSVKARKAGRSKVETAKQDRAMITVQRHHRVGRQTFDAFAAATA